MRQSVESRDTWARNLLRFSLVAAAVALVLALRWPLLALLRWVLLTQIVGTALFIGHDLIARVHCWRAGQPHAYHGAPTGLASFIYCGAEIVAAFARCIWGIRLFTWAMIKETASGRAARLH